MTPPNGTLLSPTGQRVVAVSPVLALAPLHPVVIARRAGDETYDDVLARSGSGAEAAVAYHINYQRVARANGAGPICECSLCAPIDLEPGVENPAYAAEA